MRVLIVDDNIGVRRLLRHAVSEIAQEVRECSDGAEALAAYAAYRPDVVLMDIRMPRLDGLAATRLTGQFDGRSRVVIVAEHDEEEFHNAAREGRASGYGLEQNLPGLAGTIRAVLERGYRA